MCVQELSRLWLCFSFSDRCILILNCNEVQIIKLFFYSELVLCVSSLNILAYRKVLLTGFFNIKR